MRLTLRLRNDSALRPASDISAERNRSGTVAMQSRICSDRTFCSMDADGNASNPWIVYHIEINAVHRTDRLNPPGPNRTAAHNSNGRGAYRSAGVLAGDTSCEPKTRIVTNIVPKARNIASPHRTKLVFRIEATPPEPQMTMA